MSSTASLGTLVVYLAANATQYERALKSVEASTAASMEQVVKSAKYASVAVIGSLAAIGGAGVREFAKFDEAMTGSLAIMGDVSKGTRKEMEEVARSIALNSRTAADEAAKGFRYLASAGLDAQQAMKSLPLVNKFASASLLDMETATSYLTDSVSGLGLAVKDTAQYQANLQRVSDVLTQAANISNAEADQFAASLRTKVAGALRLLNKDVEEGVAVLAAYANQGIKAENAGEQLAQVMRDLQRSSMEQPEIWRQFGIQVFDTHGKMLPLVDIVAKFEDLLGPMSDESKRATLTMLGFQDRSVGAMQALLGTSGQIREFEKALRSAGGATDDVANKQLQSLTAQTAMFVNMLKDMLITIGERLVPVLMTINSYFKDAKDSTGSWSDQVSLLADIIKTGLVVGLAVVMDVIAGWKLVIKGGQLAFAQLFRFILIGARETADTLNSAVNMGIDGINAMLRAYYQAKANITGKPQHVSFIDKVDFGNTLKILSEGATAAVEEIKEEIGTLVDAGRPSEEMFKRLAAAEAEFAGTAKEVTKTITEQKTEIVGAVKEITTSVNSLTPEFIEFQQMTRDPLATAIDQVKKFDIVLKQGQISLAQYKQATRDVVSQSNPFVAPVQGMGQMTGDQGVDEFTQVSNEEKIMQDSYNRKMAALQEYYNLKKSTDQEAAANALALQAEMEETYLANQQVFQAKRQEMILMTSQSIFDSLGDIAKNMAGEQSGIYKAMFAASKAFAIADAAVKIQQGIANAAAMPWPANLAAIASTVAATASIISNINSVAMSFEGGGHTGSGPRSGGMDGKGGFMAMLHPQERVIDEYQGQSAGGSGVVVNVHNYSDSTATVQKSDDGKTIDIMIKKVTDKVAADVRTGRGPIPQALESTYKLGRG